MKVADFWNRLACERRISRWQPTRGFPSAGFLIREDELGGYKARKYLSLVPDLLRRGVKAVRLRGSSHSNNLLQLALRLRQVGIVPYYRLEGRAGPPRGNFLFARMVLAPIDEEPAALEEIPEGAACPASLAGALTLAGSLAEGLQRHPCNAPVYIDAGTGFSAAALVLGLGALECKPEVRVVWLGDREGDFAGVLALWREQVESLLQCRLELPPWSVVVPPTARSFGAVNRTVWREVQRLASSEGVLVDPVYTAKLTLTARAAGGGMMMCGGGAFELSGFQDELARLEGF